MRNRIDPLFAEFLLQIDNGTKKEVCFIVILTIHFGDETFSLKIQLILSFQT